jgi:predicted phage terminase large subunit-like protein
MQTLTAAEKELASNTPAGLAWALSQGRWYMPPHLDLLNQALLDVATGACTRLAVFMPPRHGKSELCSHYLPAWYLAHSPDSRVILAGYGNDFAATWGRKARNAINEAHGLGMSPVWVDPSKSAADEWEIAHHEGGLYAVGIGGGVTGRGADLLVIDDPVKSRADAESLTYRERAWNWYTDDVYTRLHPGGRVVLIQTRWHQDDLAGRILEQQAADWRVIKLPALAEEDDPLGRAPGEALWPERYDCAALEERRRTLGSYGFAALFQQSPTAREGGMFRREWFAIADVHAAASARRVRYWDLAATQGGGDWTTGVLMAVNGDGIYYVEDVIHEQLSPKGVRDILLQTAELDGKSVQVWIEQEPGSSGAIVADGFRTLLAGYAVRAERPTGDKSVRADPFAAQVEAGNVVLVRGQWNRAYIEELAAFGPGCAHDDQVDASSGAFGKLAVGQPRAYVL